MATNKKKTNGFRPGRGYTESDWEEVSDNPPITKAEMAQAKPFRDVFPDLAVAIDREIARRGRPVQETTKKSVTIRLNPETIEKFKSTGRGWQSRMSDILDKAKV